jgi:hypothetical protein
MAYDREGKYYFDPEMDVSDKQALEDAERLEKAMQYRQAQQNQAQMNKFGAEAWQSALQEAGLTQEEYNRLYANDPQGSQELIKQSMKAVAKAVAQRKGQPLNQRPAQPQRRAAPQQSPKSREYIEQQKQAVNQGKVLSDDEQLDALDAVLGPDFDFFGS